MRWRELADLPFAAALEPHPGPLAPAELITTSFARVTLDVVDLRGAELGITVDPTCLRGAIVTTAQLLDMAPLLAESIGIVVKDRP